MNDSSDILIQTAGVLKNYDTPTGPLAILKGVDYAVRAGEMSFILGRSGSGKSTFLHLLGGLDEPTGGKIYFEGEELTRMNERRTAKLRCERMGFIFQFYHLLPELTLYENVLLPTLIAGRRNDAWTEECLKKVHLFSRADHYPSELSGGEKQRAAIARALVNRPSVVFCDEPTGNLDEETAGSVIALLHELNQREGQTFVIVTHDEAWAWRHPRVHRLLDGMLIPEERGPVKIEKIP